MSSTVQSLLDERLFLTNAGTETYLVFQQGFDLPEFCAFTVAEDESAWSDMERNYLWPILDTTAHHGYGLMLDSLLWRAQPDFVAKIGRPPDELARINQRAISETRGSVGRWREASGIDKDAAPVLIVADIGPRGDAYRADGTGATREAARDYHRQQVGAAAGAGVDLVCALTMTGAEESIGIVQATAEAGLPIIVSPTVETDGRLPDGTTLGDFIADVDAATDAAPLFYMVNCAHPTHLRRALDDARERDAAWLRRFRGFRTNASKKSHEELDNSTELDRGDVKQLATEMADLRRDYGLRVIGGCCGTDHEHLDAIARASLT